MKKVVYKRTEQNSVDFCIATGGDEVVINADFGRRPNKVELEDFVLFLEPIKQVRNGYRFYFGLTLIQISEMDGKYIFTEQKSDDGLFSDRLDLSLSRWSAQSFICASYSLPWNFCDPQKMLTFTPSALSGDRLIEGVRDAEDEHNSGWWIMSDEPPENEGKYEQVAVAQVVHNHPEISQFLGIPVGYSFSFDGQNTYVWQGE